MGRLRGRFDLLAQVHHMHIDGPVADVPVEAVQFGKQLRAGEDPAGRRRERAEDPELTGCALHRAAVDRHQMPDGIDHQPAHGQHTVGGVVAGRAPGAAQQRTHPGHQFPGAVGLGDVVVRAEVEAEQQIVLGGARGQHQHRHLPVLGPQDAHHVQAVGPGHHHVQDQQVRLPLPDRFQGREAVADGGDRMPFAFQVAAQEFGLLLIVFGDDHMGAHAPYHIGVRKRRAVADARAAIPDRVSASRGWSHTHCRYRPPIRDP